MIKNPVLEDIQNLDYEEIIIVTIRKEIIRCSLGNSLPHNLRGTTFKVKRTGSHTVQRTVSAQSWFHNIMANQIEVIYTKDKDPEYFI